MTTAPSSAEDEVVELCRDLIRIDSSNPTSNERKAAMIAMAARAFKNSRHDHPPSALSAVYGGDCFLASACRVRLSWEASRSHVLSATPRSRSLYFCTLPLSVIGSSRMNSRYRGTAK